MTAVKLDPEPINEEDINIGAEGSDDNVQYGVLTPTNPPPITETKQPEAARSDCELVEIKPTGTHCGGSRIPVINGNAVYQNGFLTSSNGGFEAAVNGSTDASSEKTDNPMSSRRFISPVPVSFIRPSSDGEFRTMPHNLISFKQVVPGPETLEVKRKIEKKKAKKAAGWTKSEEMSDHVQMSDISDILNFVGEKNDVETSSQGNTQKKKLRKKLSSKQKSGTKNTLSNGKTEGPSSTSSDSEDNIDSAIVRNGASVVTGKPSQQQSLKSNKPAEHGASAPMSNGYMAGPGEIDNSGAVVNSENEFTEVLHRKKKAPNKTVTMGAGMERNGKTPNHHQYDRPQIPRNNVRPASNQGMYGKTPDNTTNKPSPSLTKPDIDVDLSINSFPALGPQLPNGDAKFSSHNESTSATDDDKDSVSSQPFVPGPSWAKIAAKPTINTTPVKVNTESITPRLVIPVESAAVVAAAPRELEVTLPDLTSHQFPDLTSKTPAATAALTSTSESPSDILNNPCASSISNVSSEAQPKSICDTASATVSQEQTNTEDMSSSTSSLLSIEFGTVTSSSDWQSNQRVQHILSQSYSEGSRVQSIPNNKTQTVPRTVEPSAGNSAAAAISSRFMPSLSSSIKGCSSKGVQFLDRPSGMPSPNQHIDITFGFHSDDDLPSTGASAQNIDSQINTSMSMSYPPPSKSITSLPAKVEPSSSAVDDGRPESAQPPAAQPAATCQPLTAAAGGIKSTNNTTRHRDDKPGASASVAANILHNIMSMECNHKPVRSTGNVFKTAVGMDNCDGFDVLATIKMLRKEWDFVMQQRHKHNGKVRYLTELPRSN